MRHWENNVKNEAKKMRLDGATYGEIVKKFGIAKSTLNGWFKGLPLPNHLYFTNKLEWLKKIRILSAESKRKTRILKETRIALAVKNEVDSWGFLNTCEAQKSLLAMLYWAEGQKSPNSGAPVNFTNTDPKLMLLFLTLLRNCYHLDESKLRVRLHLHWYHKVNKVRSFWSMLLNIDESKFGKIYLKQRSKTKKFRKNFAGICFLRYHSIDLRREIMQTAYNINDALVAQRIEHQIADLRVGGSIPSERT